MLNKGDNKLYSQFVSIFVIWVLVCAGLMGFYLELEQVCGSRSTEVSGIISTNTTWTLLNSPYIITEDIVVEIGATLTIEPGVEIKFDGDYYILVKGALIAIGTEDNLITFTSNNSVTPGSWDTIYFSSYSNDAVYDDNGTYLSGSIIKYCIIEYGGSTGEHFSEVYDNGAIILEKANPHIENNLIINNAQGIAHEFSTAKILNNTIQRNQEYGIDGHSSSLYINENIICNNKGGIYAQDFSTINNNIISGNKDLGIWFYGSSTGQSVTYNHIVNNGKAGIYSFDGPADVNYNNLYGNGDYQVSRNYKEHGGSPNDKDINATNNWWGTTNTAIIDTGIYDYYDDYGLGKVIYQPFLTSPLNPRNTPPIADANEDQEDVTLGQTVFFDGSGSYDFEGDPLSYKWDFGDGTSTGWQNECDSSHAYNMLKNYRVTLTVSDGSFIDWDTCIIYVTNQQPVANAGSDQNAKVNETVNFNGNGTYDPDGDTLRYKWDFGDGTFTDWQYDCDSSHSYNQPGNYTVTLHVNDGKIIVNDTCIVYVTKSENDNSPPIADAGPDQNANIDQTVYFDGSGSYDPDEDILIYDWDFGDGASTGWQNDCNTTHRYNTTGQYTIILTVSDGELTDFDACVVQVQDLWFVENRQPIVNAGPDQYFSVGQIVYFDGSDTYDPDGDILTYKWDFGDGTFTDWQSDCNTSHIYTNSGIYTIILTVDDGKLTDFDTCIVYISDPIDNLPPIAVASANPTVVKVGDQITFDATGSYDPDGHELTYKWRSDIDGGFGESVIVKIILSEGQHNITLEVSDSYSFSYDYLEIIVFSSNSESDDSDGDGLPDVWEKLYYLDPDNPNDAEFDTDGDTLTNLEEYQIGTNPIDKDTDTDGVLDNTDEFPTDPNETKDTDGDGFGDNFDKFPNDATEWLDTDGDGVGDNTDAFPYDSDRYLDPKIDDKRDLNDITIIFIVLIIIILIVLIVMFMIVRKKRQPPEDPPDHYQIINQLMNEAVYNDDEFETDFPDSKLKTILDQKYKNGEISLDTHNYISDNFLTSKRPNIARINLLKNHEK